MLLCGCKQGRDEILSWPLDVENGFRFFIGVCNYSYEEENPEVQFLVKAAEGNMEAQQIEMTDKGVVVGGELYYFYDISEEWGGKDVEITIAYTQTNEHYSAIVNLKEERNLWFVVSGNEFNQVPAPVSKDNP